MRSSPLVVPTDPRMPARGTHRRHRVIFYGSSDGFGPYAEGLDRGDHDREVITVMNSPNGHHSAAR